ncbi:MAG: TetR family transcriptional regulator [Nevskia sp.]|nr:TetR family transcriptional regulator [Nevskia sp.]
MKLSARPSDLEPTSDPSARQAIKRNRKSQRTRRHLAEVAVELFEKKGFAATTIDEITDTSDYSSSTFFRLFTDKEEVVFYDFVDLLEQLKAIFAMPNHGNAWVTIRSVFIEFAHLWDTDAGELGLRRARLYHSEPLLYARFLAKNSDWEGEMAKLVLAELKNDQRQVLLSRVIAGAASSAFRAAFRTKFENEDLKLAPCVRDAFDKLERIGEFFQTNPTETPMQLPQGKNRKTPRRA